MKQAVEKGGGFLHDTCRAGTWQCPNGYELLAQYPLDSCARGVASCCDDETGAIVEPPCGAELRCVSGGLWFCGTVCACTANDSGTLSWHCEQVTCP